MKARIGLALAALAMATMVASAADTYVSGSSRGVVYASLWEEQESIDIVDVRVMPDGNVLVCGSTPESVMASRGPGLYTVPGGGGDGFIAIMSPDLSKTLAFTFVGGYGRDSVTGVAVDVSGNVFVTGTTTSPDMPATVGIFGQTYSSQVDGFIMKLTPALDSMYWMSYIPGFGDELPTAIAVDAFGDVYMCGQTTSKTGFPVSGGYRKQYIGGIDAFVMKVSAAGGLLYSSYFGSEGTDVFLALAVQPDRQVVVTGYTTSANFETFPKTAGGWQTPSNYPYDNSYNGGDRDVVVVKFNADGSGLVYSTFYGGNEAETGRAVMVDDRGRVTVVGETRSPNIPVSSGTAFLQGGSDVFAAQFSEEGKLLVKALTYGGRSDDIPRAGALLSSDRMMIVGQTSSSDFPLAGSGLASSFGGATDGFVIQLAGWEPTYASYFGWDGSDEPIAAALDANGDLFVAGRTTSTKTGPTQPNQDGSGGGRPMIAKFANGVVSLLAPTGNERPCIGTTMSFAWATTDLPASEPFVIERATDPEGPWNRIAGPMTSRTYQWTIADVGADGDYYFRVRTARGHAQRTAKAIRFVAPITITQQPQAAAACGGDRVELSCSVAGDVATFQWRQNGTAIEGATSPTYVIPSLDANTAGRYEVAVTGGCAGGLMSSSVAVTLKTSTAITAQPTSVDVVTGQPLTIPIVAVGTNLTFVWRKNGEVLSGQTSATLTVGTSLAVDAGTYTCTITGDCGEVTSEPVEVKVSPSTSVDETPAAVFGVVPNPALDEIRLTLPSAMAGTTLTVVDMTGQVVATVAVPAAATSITLDVRSLATGTYALRATVAGSPLTAGFTVVR